MFHIEPGGLDPIIIKHLHKFNVFYKLLSFMNIVIRLLCHSACNAQQETPKVQHDFPYNIHIINYITICIFAIKGFHVV